MKDVILVVLACGMFVTCNNQNETTTGTENTTDKWVINKVNEKFDNGKERP